MDTLTVSRLSVTLGQQLILRSVDLSLGGGQVVALLGPNGAGKSTLLKTLTGELPYQGQIRLWQKDRDAWNRAQLAKTLAILPQQSYLTFPFTVREVVALGAMPLRLTQTQLRPLVAQMMQCTGVTHLADRSYLNLSGGEKQRVHFARVLLQLSQAGQQKILVLDEPTAALDLAYQHQMLRLAQQQAEQGALVIVVIHDLNLAAQYADQLVLMTQGKVYTQGSPWQVLTEANILDVYGWPMLVTQHPKGYPIVYAG